MTSRNLHGDRVDQPFARIDTSTPYWYLADHLGSIRTVIDGNGVTKDAIVYDGYGKITSESDSTKRGLYSWTGRELDAETNLQYNRARYYDATTGRWISQDPLGFDAGDSNLYRYVSNRTTTATDPSGREIRIYVSNMFEGQVGHVTIVVYNTKLKPNQKAEANVYDGGGPTFAGAPAQLLADLAAYRVGIDLLGNTPIDPPLTFDKNIRAREIKVALWKVENKDKNAVLKELKKREFFAKNKIQPDLADFAYATTQGHGDIIFRKDLDIDATVQPFDQFQRIGSVFSGFKGGNGVPAVSKLKQLPIYSLIGPNSNSWARQLMINAGFGNAADFAIPSAPAWNFKHYALQYGGEAYDTNGNAKHNKDWKDSRGFNRRPNGIRR